VRDAKRVPGLAPGFSFGAFGRPSVRIGGPWGTIAKPKPTRWRIFPGRTHMSSKVGHDSNYVAHHVEVAIGSREAEIRARKLRQLAVSACVVGFLLVAAFILL